MEEEKTKQQKPIGSTTNAFDILAQGLGRVGGIFDWRSHAFAEAVGNRQAGTPCRGSSSWVYDGYQASAFCIRT